MAFPVPFALYYSEPVAPFLVAIATTLVVGFGLEQLTSDRDLGPREAFLMVALAWLLVPAVGAIPFVVAGVGAIAHPINALFEAMSGVTTTGATTLVDFDRHSRSILMWRQMIQWLGGLGILVIATAILSELGVGGAQLMETEAQTKSSNRLTPKISETARLLWKLYVGITVANIAILFGLHLTGIAPNMTFYNAIAHPLTTVSTAGFSPEADSIMAFSPAVQWVIILFMIIGATNFILLLALLNGNHRRLLKSEEFRFYLSALGIFSLLVAMFLVLESNHGSGQIEHTIRSAVFNVVSIMTTTGYANADFDLWGESAKHMLFLCMFIGGMAGSTTCSIKSLRWLVVLKGFRRDLFTAIHPEAVKPVRLSGGVVDEQTIRDIYAFTLVSLLIFFLATVFVAIDAARVGLPLTEFEAMGAAAATFFNIGPAFGILGPFGTYEVLPMSTKVVMIFLMWIGRIEIIPVLVLFTQAFWRS